ncbi:MAG TPA: class I adenylate-forming enzyme family protein [Chthoniobacterales bacterium]|jgi:acyl-CoA synthetase (AMP-forming)/AMP-acid ligase II
MKSPSSDPIVDRWEGTVRRQPDRPALFDATARVLRTFAEIEVEAARWEEQFAALQAGTVLAVQIGNHPAWPAVLIAGLRREIIILALETTITDGERAAIMKTCRCRGLLAADENGSANLRPLGDAASAPSWGNLPRPSLLKLTSGTTAAPRAIRFRSQQLLADCDQICDTMGIAENDLNFGVIPVSHSYGFSNLITPLLARGVAMVMSRDRLPRAVLDGLARTRATVFPGMPVFFQAFCAVEETPDLSSLRLCISAGAPLSGALAERFREKFGQSIHSFYGSSECGGICYDRTGESLSDGYVGSAMNGVQVEGVDSAAAASQVRVSSAAVADGYFPEQDASGLGRGVFVPDDLLERCGSGWRIAGRVSDLINVAGMKVNPAEVEAHLMALPGVRQAVVFGRRSALRNEEVAACVVTEENVGEAELLRSCRQRLSGCQVPRRIFVVSEIPVNERGKTSRRDLAARFGQLG